MAIEVAVSTQYMGKVAVRQRFVEQALKEKKDLVIIHERSIMRIRHTEIHFKTRGKSDTLIQDKFRRNPPGYLYYFDWNPDVKQEVLL